MESPFQIAAIFEMNAGEGVVSRLYSVVDVSGNKVKRTTTLGAVGAGRSAHVDRP